MLLHFPYISVVYLQSIHLYAFIAYDHYEPAELHRCS